ncbi:hypothetical protein HPB48_004968 [Haemaphysalis longicornis]|uniref:Fibronectin type-III domain-containing protein n=1 Tax=Haemaphysalis longicornis TaxID=44386 RepID=A0A9J6GEK8_HAELO|nr:hypothetical protein HPB48_004968 [Haemaphysalis longicornis]
MADRRWRRTVAGAVGWRWLTGNSFDACAGHRVVSPVPKHQLRMRSASDVGRGPEGNVITASTEGNRPVLQQPDRLVESNSSAAWLRPDAWWHGGCPISHFTVHYRRSAEADWTLVSSHLPYKHDEPLVLSELTPGSWYVLLMVAHNDAGSTTAQVNFATLTLDGGSVSGERYKSEVLASPEPTYCGGSSRGSSAYAVPHRVYDVPYAHKRPGTVSRQTTAQSLRLVLIFFSLLPFSQAS